MKVYFQNLLLLLPLFVGLGLVGGALMFSAGRNEAEWGAREEARAAAVAAAAFLSQATPSTAVVTSEPLSSERLAFARVRLGRVVARGGARRVRLLSPDGAQTLLDTGVPVGGTLAPAASPFAAETRAALARGEVVLTGILGADGKEFHLWGGGAGTAAQGSASAGTGSGEPYLTAYAPVHLQAKTAGMETATVAVVAAEIGASGYVAHTQRLERSVGILLVIVSALGFLIAHLLSRRLVGEVDGLHATAARMASGDLDEGEEPAERVAAASVHVREVDDLANILGTMRDVLRDTLAQTRRSLIEGGQYRTKSDLARTHQNLFLPRIVQRWEALTLIVARSGRTHAQDTAPFWGVVTLSAESGAPRRFAFVGRFRKTIAAAKEMDAAVAATAVTAVLRQYLTIFSPEVAFARASDMFDLAALEVICCPVPATGNEILRYRFGEHVAITEPEQVAIAMDRPVVLHTYRDLPEVEERITAYADLFGHLPPAQLWEDLVQVILPGDSPEGCILILSMEPVVEGAGARASAPVLGKEVASR